MSLFVNLIFSFLGPRTLATFCEECHKPTETQERLLKHIITKNGGTAFGKVHGFSNIGSFEHFQRRVPITSYEELKPYIEASLHGEPNQLTAERPVFFATTSYARKPPLKILSDAHLVGRNATGPSAI